MFCYVLITSYANSWTLRKKHKLAPLKGRAQICLEVWGGKEEEKDLFHWGTPSFLGFVGFLAEQLLEKNDLRKDGKASCGEPRNGKCSSLCVFSPLSSHHLLTLNRADPWAWREGLSRELLCLLIGAFFRIQAVFPTRITLGLLRAL